MRNFQIEQLVIARKTPTTVFATTAGGIYKSTDRGASWQLLATGMPAKSVTAYSVRLHAVAIDFQNPSVVYAAGSTGSRGVVYKSIDGGNRWQPIPSQAVQDRTTVNDIAIDPKISDIIYIATDHGILKSWDGGRRWTDATNGLPNAPVLKIAIDPADTAILYATLKPLPGGQPGKVVKSKYGGASWIQVLNLPAIVGQSENRSSYFDAIIVDPRTPDTIFVADRGWVTGGIYKSTDGGDTWSMSYMDKSLYFGGHRSVNAVALAPDGHTVFYGTPYYVAKSTDGGHRWQQAIADIASDGDRRVTSRGLNSTVVETIAVDPHDENIVYVGHLDIGLWRTTDGGKSWQSSIADDLRFLSVRAIVPDPDVKGLIYAGTSQSNSLGHGPGALIVSPDYGATWRPINITDAPTDRFAVSAIAINPSRETGKRALYVGLFGGGVYKFIDGGRIWLPQNDGLPANPRIYTLFFDPAGQMLYAGLTCDEPANSHGGVYRLADGARHWEQIDLTARPYGHIVCPFGIAVDPNDSGRLYVASKSYIRDPLARYAGVWTSDDSGKSWSLLQQTSMISAKGAFARRVVVDRWSRVYALFEHNPCSDLYTPPDVPTGLYISEDTGATWRAENEGISFPNAHSFAVAPSGRMFLGTSGTGLYRTTPNAK